MDDRVSAVPGSVADRVEPVTGIAKTRTTPADIGGGLRDVAPASAARVWLVGSRRSASRSPRRAVERATHPRRPAGWAPAHAAIDGWATPCRRLTGRLLRQLCMVKTPEVPSR